MKVETFRNYWTVAQRSGLLILGETKLVNKSHHWNGKSGDLQLRSYA